MKGLKQYTHEDVLKVFEQQAGNVSATARALGLVRGTVQEHLRKVGANKKPLAAGSLHERKVEQMPLPPAGLIARYILTSAQNNTLVNDRFWNALRVLANHYDAPIFIGTFTYNQNSFGTLAVKRGTMKDRQRALWYDPKIEAYVKDAPVELAPGLVWCGEMNILPTAVDPLAGLETYTHRLSSIFPHAKLTMRSVATMQGEDTKLMYTTGTVTQRNYVQKKEGIKAEHHHRYAALVVEVDHDGHWWVRQVGMGSRADTLQDLNVVVKNGKVCSKNGTVEAITWGDLHATKVEPAVLDASLNMLDALRPKYQFLHDVLEGASINRHIVKENCPHYGFYRWLRGLHRVDAELKQTALVIESYLRPWCQTVVPDSNHDGWWLKSWLKKFDYRVDPANAELFLKLQAYMYEQIRAGKMPKEVNITAQAFAEVGYTFPQVRFLLPDESFTICDRKIECGMHGHLGPDGAHGTPSNLNQIGRRANTAHTHSAGIWNGLYVAGTSAQFRWTYNYGPSSWSHSHVVTYPNGQRTIVTMYAGKWHA